VSAESRTWVFSGAELFSALKGIPEYELSDKETGRAFSVARASAYISGVADALQNREWCGGGAVLPHEMNDQVFTYLKTLPPERLQDNAAPLVIRALAETFPCRKG